MSQSTLPKQTISVGSRQQLIDLNGETVNFDLTFTATSKNGAPFDIVVVDQTTLDNTPDLEFKHANGTISGNLLADKNVYQNYFLCIKAEQPCEVDITIDKKDIRPNLEQQQMVTPPPPLAPPQKPRGTNWKMVFMVLLILGGGAYLYYLYMNKNKEENLGEPTLAKIPSPIPVAPTIPIMLSPPVPVSNLGYKKANESLMARLNSLPLK